MGFWGFLREHDEMYDAEYLKPLKTYKYRGIDKSPISQYILRPYWNFCTTLFPLWVAPNMITLLGFLLMILALVIVAIYCPDLETPLHPACYVLFCACIWIYSTFDNVDGKQARRTGTSSPLGELFDHGCDALNCWVMGIVQMASLCMGTGVASCIIMAIFFWGFYLPTWEHFHTGILYLGYINGPTEGVIFGCVLLLISAYYGPQVWHAPVRESFPRLAVTEYIASHTPLFFAAVFILFGFFVLQVPTSLYFVYRACRKNGRSFGKALSQLFFMAVSTLAAYAWLWSPHTTARREHFILFHVAIGIAFGKMTTKIILAHLIHQPFPQFTGLMFPLIAGSVLFNLPVFLPSVNLAQYERTYLLIYLGVVLIGYGNWIYHVINSFCAFLDINCLTIKRVKRKTSVEVVVEQYQPKPESPLLTKKQYALPIKPKAIPSKLVL